MVYFEKMIKVSLKDVDFNGEESAFIKIKNDVEFDDDWREQLNNCLSAYYSFNETLYNGRAVLARELNGGNIEGGLDFACRELNWWSWELIEIETDGDFEYDV